MWGWVPEEESYQDGKVSAWRMIWVFSQIHGFARFIICSPDTSKQLEKMVFQFYKWELKFWEVRQSWIAEWLRRWESCFESRDTASWDSSPLAQQSSAAQGALSGSSRLFNSILMGVISLPARPGGCSHPDTEIWVGNRANGSSGYKTKAGSFWITEVEWPATRLSLSRLFLWM